MMKKHKKIQSRKEYFFYNKENELIRLIEKSKDNNFFRLREIIDNSFITHWFIKKNGKKVDESKEIRVYPHKCHFNHLLTQGENYLLPVEKGKFLLQGYSKYTKSFSSQNDNLETFTIKPDLINTWVNKLKK